MFWRFGFHNPSAIDTLLDREEIELEDILEEEDLLQEAKSHNQKLVEFLCKPENLHKLLYYITATDLDESRRFKYPFLACEIMACEIPQIVDAVIVENKGMLEQFWKFLDRPVTGTTGTVQAVVTSTPAADADASAPITADDNATPNITATTTTTTIAPATISSANLTTATPQKEEDVESGGRKMSNEEEEDGDDDGEELDALHAQYFCKTISVFLTKRTGEVLEFIKSKPEHLDQILRHLQTSAIMDLLLTLVRVEELSEGKGIVQWLSDHGLLDNLVNRLDPNLDSEEHSVAQQCICEIIRMSQTSLVESPSIGLNDLIMDLKSERVIKKLADFMLDTKAPNSTSTLINGVTIIIDLIRHNNCDIDIDPAMNGGYGYSGNTISRQKSVSLADMLKVLADRVGDFNQLLIHPRSVNGPMRTTLGEQIPLGFERLKICELFAELLHCSNMSNLNGEDDNEEEQKQKGKEEDATTIGDYLKMQFVQDRVMATCIDLFFSFPWNNFLHYVIYDMLHQVFNGRMDKGYNRNLAISIFKDGKLTDRMVAAQKANDEECAKPRGMRLGYMGHLTFIADEIIKVFEGYPETIVSMIKNDVDIEKWHTYCNNDLKETKERDRLPLAGPRPNDGLDGGGSEEEDEEDPMDDITASQYSRYLGQHDGDLDEDEDEETENWITGRDDYDREYSYGATYGIGDVQDARQDELEDEEEKYGSDDDEEAGNVPAGWSRGFVGFPQTSMLHRTQSHIQENEDGSQDKQQQQSQPQRTLNDDGDEEEDPFGDFASGDNDTSTQDWTAGFSTHFESVHISGEGSNTTNLATTAVATQKTNESNRTSVDHDYVRAVKTKEEENAKMHKEYSPEEEQQGEI
ncbi:SIT4 phosphatase-associated protein-domain-containing protein [Dichotomocladium elegans]|nr:SIT4 phosphatase-associated protein-domain-containing protein [Dichotomocladium elegans]